MCLYPAIAALLLLCAAALGGCGPRRLAEPAHVRYRGDVHLLRGLFNVWSTGMDEVAQKLEARGVKAQVLAGPQWLGLGERIVKERQQGERRGPLVLVGHSYGADDSVRLARYLKEKGVRVDGLVLVDPTTPPVVPDNVTRCFNLYKSHPDTDWMPWFRGVPVKIESTRTQLVNYDLRVHDPTGRYANIDHFSIDNNPDVHATVIREVIRTLANGQN